MESQFDPGEGAVADLPADLVEADPAAYDQLLDGLLVFAHVGGELLQGSEGQLGAGLLVLGAAVGAVRQAVQAVAQPHAGHLVLAPRHVLQNSTSRNLKTKKNICRLFKLETGQKNRNEEDKAYLPSVQTAPVDQNMAVHSIVINPQMKNNGLCDEVNPKPSYSSVTLDTAGQTRGRQVRRGHRSGGRLRPHPLIFFLTSALQEMNQVT